MAQKKNSGKWAPHERIDLAKESLTDRPDVNLSGGDQFATRTRANDFLRLMRTLPDPDPVLRKMGRGITALQELLADSHMESVWSVRCSAASGAEWFMAAGNEGRREQEAADAFAAELADMDVPRIIEEMMDAVAYGYSPLEVLWTAKEGRWGIENIVGKPPQWFEFNGDNKLVFRTGINGAEELPENRFLLVRHRPSYANPYGDKVFSKCFWPATFKKNGWRWWTVFVEKYGGAFAYGTYAKNASQEDKAELLKTLEKMIADAVAVVPEGTEVTIASAADKGGSSAVHAAYIQMANAEISKAVLGQTLTTEIGDKGSYAAAQTHNEVREHLAAADRRRISAAFNRLASAYTFYNFGGDAAPPLFTFVEDEDLQMDKAERDVMVHQMGYGFSKEYISRVYGIPEEDLIAREASGEPSGNDTLPGFSRPENHPADCPCGCREPEPGLFKNIAALFAPKAEKAARKDERLMREFGTRMLAAGQDEIDQAVEAYVDALGGVNSFDGAAEALLTEYNRRNPARLAALTNEIRYAASGIGGRRG
jgi:phage gp29-like protein